MPMLCIAGTFQVVGSVPDGDSIRFVPTDPREWERVPGRHAVLRNAHGGAQLRLDAIDALETHYAPRGGRNLHQPRERAHEAADELLAWFGFTGVQRVGEKVTAVDRDALPGFILTRNADRNGRCVSFAGRGAPPAASGTFPRFTVEHLRATVNHHLLRTGRVYPTYYSQLFGDLRDELTAATAAARHAGAGLWPHDRTQAGAAIASMASITDEAVLLPKLFRRLADYLHLNAPDASLAGFGAFLSQQGDRLSVVSESRRASMSAVVAVSGQTVRLTHAPEDLVFDEG